MTTMLQEPTGTAASTPGAGFFPAWPAPPEGVPDFAAALRERGEARCGGEVVAARARLAGILRAPSGRIVAADPLVAPETEALPVEVPRGAHPVVAGVVETARGPRVVAAAVLLSRAAPALWKRLQTHAVDSGASAFMDLAAAEAMTGDVRMTGRLLEAIESVEGGGPALAAFSPSGGDAGPGLVAFPSGAGDGTYLTWAAYGADGALVALVTGTGLLEGDAPSREDRRAGERPPAPEPARAVPAKELLPQLQHDLGAGLYPHDGGEPGLLRRLAPDAEAWIDGAGPLRGGAAILEAVRAACMAPIDLGEARTPSPTEAYVAFAWRRTGEAAGTLGIVTEGERVRALRVERRAGARGLVPALAGSLEADARRAAESHGYALLAEGIDDAAPAGTVIRQAPPAGAPWTRGAIVWVGVSRGPDIRALVPALAGGDHAAGRASLEGAGLAVAAVEQHHATAPAGQVLEQSPAPGAMLRRGSTVRLVVSRGPAPEGVALPALQGLAQGEAEARLASLGLRKGMVRLRPVPGSAPGTVLESSPRAGASVARGAFVDLVVVKR